MQGGGKNEKKKKIRGGGDLNVNVTKVQENCEGAKMIKGGLQLFIVKERKATFLSFD